MFLYFVLMQTAVTDALRDVLSGTTTNYGWIIIGDESTMMSTAQFQSSESSTNQPTLYVESGASQITATSAVVVSVLVAIMSMVFM
eukprot:m.43279 g.43279  ORF g.43279 m.43279 type:complete len:86 (-) comp10548_c0_seq1:84-341(-)